MTQDDDSPQDEKIDTDDYEDRELNGMLQGSEWAFVWAILTICLVALAALAGWAWRTWA